MQILLNNILFLRERKKERKLVERSVYPESILVHSTNAITQMRSPAAFNKWKVLIRF